MASRRARCNRAVDQLLQHLSKPLGVPVNVIIARQQTHRQLDSPRACLGLVVLQYIPEQGMNIEQLPRSRWNLGIKRGRFEKSTNW